MEPYDVAVGEKVLVFHGWSRGKPTDAVVVKIGRTLVHITEHGTKVSQYRRADQRSNDGHGSYFRTFAQQEAIERREEARVRLRDIFGVEIRAGYYEEWPAAKLMALADAAAGIQRERSKPPPWDDED